MLLLILWIYSEILVIPRINCIINTKLVFLFTDPPSTEPRLSLIFWCFQVMTVVANRTYFWEFRERCTRLWIAALYSVDLCVCSSSISLNHWWHKTNITWCTLVFVYTYIHIYTSTLQYTVLKHTCSGLGRWYRVLVSLFWFDLTWSVIVLIVTFRPKLKHLSYLPVKNNSFRTTYK